jgi:glycerol kinase
VFIGGAVVQWLRDGLKLISESADSEYFASKVEDSGGVYIVPAFTGLGAPHWDMYARGAVFGITRGSGRDHIIRAALESIAYQVYDVLRAMEDDAAVKIGELRVDGGASENNLLMQFQSDITGATVLRPKIRETTAFGAACLAGLATGVWNGVDELKSKWGVESSFKPGMPPDKAKKLRDGWARAVERAKDWADDS